MKHQGRPIRMQMGEAVHKVRERQAKMLRNALGLALAQAHKTRPAAAITATLAKVGFRNFRHLLDLASWRHSRYGVCRNITDS